MKRLRLIRIAATFLLTFALGVAAGWRLKPTSPAATVGVARIEASAEGALTKLAERLKFTADQKNRLRPLFEEWSGQAGQAGRNQRRRLELFEQNVPRIREVLTATQRAEFDRLAIEVRQRFDTRLRRNAGQAPD
jgi:Spy/CpxP family protein refolding chaperone